MKKNTLIINLSIYLSCFILTVLGDGIYRHFGKGLTITDAFWQVLWAYGTMVVFGTILFAVITFIYFVSRMITKKKDKQSDDNSKNKL